MKKVCIFLDYYGYGGIEKVINDIYYNFNDKYEIDLLSFCSINNSDKVIHLLNKEYKNFFIRNILGIFKIKRHFKNKKYDIIHINCYNSFGYIYAFLFKKYCKKIIIHGHNSSIDKDSLNVKRFINFMIKKIFKSNCITITPSDDVNDFCFENKNNILLPNGIDYKKYYFNNNYRNYYRKMFNIKDNEIVIGMIGRFEKQKNYEFAIEIFKKLTLINNNYKLVLIGTGSLLNKIKEQVRAYDIDKKVLFLSNRSDLNELINMFDIYIQPSLYEGFGLSIVENEINGKYVFVSNNISKSVKISNRIKYLPLDIDLWINEIINLKENNFKLSNELELNNFLKELDKIYRK